MERVKADLSRREAGGVSRIVVPSNHTCLRDVDDAVIVSFVALTFVSRAAHRGAHLSIRYYPLAGNS